MRAQDNETVYLRLLQIQPPSTADSNEQGASGSSKQATAGASSKPSGGGARQTSIGEYMPKKGDGTIILRPYGQDFGAYDDTWGYGLSAPGPELLRAFLLQAGLQRQVLQVTATSMPGWTTSFRNHCMHMTATSLHLHGRLYHHCTMCLATQRMQACLILQHFAMLACGGSDLPARLVCLSEPNS
jgi:hypothetical protein